jgi:hypothetical protein
MSTTTSTNSNTNYGRTYADNEVGAGPVGIQSAMLTGKVALVTGSGMFLRPTLLFIQPLTPHPRTWNRT